MSMARARVCVSEVEIGRAHSPQIKKLIHMWVQRLKTERLLHAYDVH